MPERQLISRALMEAADTMGVHFGPELEVRMIRLVVTAMPDIENLCRHYGYIPGPEFKEIRGFLAAFVMGLFVFEGSL